MPAGGLFNLDPIFRLREARRDPCDHEWRDSRASPWNRVILAESRQVVQIPKAVFRRSARGRPECSYRSKARDLLPNDAGAMLNERERLRLKLGMGSIS